MDRAHTTEAQRIGDEGERLAAARLEALGWDPRAATCASAATRWTCVAVDPGPPAALVVIVEVRRRGRRDFGLAEETLDHRKRTALRRVAGGLRCRTDLPDGSPLPRLPLRIDLVAIDSRPDGRPSVRHHRGIAP